MKKISFILICLWVHGLWAQIPGRRQLADSIDLAKQELLHSWYPRAVDSVYGGFLTTFTFDFKPAEPQDKFIVTQARHVWTNAMAAMQYPSVPYYLASSRQGVAFLRRFMWDSTYGGFYNLVSREGQNKSDAQAPKDAYGNAFAIYALATYYKASKDSAALSLAIETFMWLEKHSYDARHRGYFQHLQRNGGAIERPAHTPAGSPLGYKDQNSSIHLLEAFTALYEVWKAPILKRRLGELLALIRDTITTNKGYLQLFFQPDWTPVSFRDSSEAFILQNHYLDHVSFGHDVETAYLLLEASHALGNKQKKKTLTVAKRMIDHALTMGWDHIRGGFYDEGYYFKDGFRIIKATTNWWAQAEGLNSLLMMADLYPKDPMRYYIKFIQLWYYINTSIIDHEYGDWFEEGIDRAPQRRTALKGHMWKATYHQYRAMHNCIERLRH